MNFWLFVTVETFPLWIFAILIVGKIIERHYRPSIERDVRP